VKDPKHTRRCVSFYAHVWNVIFSNAIIFHSLSKTKRVKPGIRRMRNRKEWSTKRETSHRRRGVLSQLLSIAQRTLFFHSSPRCCLLSFFFSISRFFSAFSSVPLDNAGLDIIMTPHNTKYFLLLNYQRVTLKLPLPHLGAFFIPLPLPRLFLLFSYRSVLLARNIGIVNGSEITRVECWKTFRKNLNADTRVW